MVIKSKMAIVLARTNRADHVDARIARVPSKMARTLYELTPQSRVLGCLALISNARCAATVSVEK